MEIMKKMFILVFFLLASPAFAQECPVPPRTAFENNPDCHYSEENISYDPMDSCYQKYLDRKFNYVQSCYTYWREKEKEELKNLPSPSPQEIETIIIKEVSVPTPVPQKIGVDDYTQMGIGPSREELRKELGIATEAAISKKKAVPQQIGSNDLLQTENALSRFIYNLWEKIKSLFRY